MDPQQREPEILLIHDGELDDVRQLLDELGAPCEELRRSLDPPEPDRRWRLVVGTARRMLDPQNAPDRIAGKRPTSIAVLDSDSRTLRANLRRIDVDYVVRRPVHPAALRLLLLYTLYSGPERRRHPRMSVGVPVRYRTGLLRRRAILTDLSMHGCGLISKQSLEVGCRLIVSLPPKLGVGRTLRLRGRVVRSRIDAGSEPGSKSLAVVFEDRPVGVEERLQNAVMVHACGPARLPKPAPVVRRQTAPPQDPVTLETPCEGETAPESDPGREAQPAAGDEIDASTERRAEPRRDFSRRVIVLGEEAAKIMVGRDLSHGGMRVDADSNLSLGDELRLAIPLQAGEAPLVVEARVTRDDGSGGLVLGFEDLSDDAKMLLKHMLGYLPISRSEPDPDSDYANLVVSEVLEHRDG